ARPMTTIMSLMRQRIVRSVAESTSTSSKAMGVSGIGGKYEPNFSTAYLERSAPVKKKTRSRAPGGITMTGDARGARDALTAAVLFGAGAPVAKLLVPSAGPTTLAGLLYFGAGLALVLVRLASPAATPREAALTRRDVPFVLVVVAAGGMLAPWLL